MKSERMRAALACLLVAALYGWGVLSMGADGAVWSPDCGARLIEVRSILQHWPQHWVSYPALSLDPGHRFSPLAFYEYSFKGRTYLFYSYFFVYASAILFKYFGYAGLGILPALGGLGAALAAYALARLAGVRFPSAVLLLVGLGTPVAVYSVVFWDHSITCCVGAVCLLCCAVATATGRTWLWLAAGACWGLGISIHEILIPYLPAMVVGAWWIRHRQPFMPNAIRLILGAILFAVPLAIFNHNMYGNWLGPHLSKNHLGSAVGMGQFLLRPGQWVPGALYTLFAWGDISPGFTSQLRAWMSDSGFRWEMTFSAVMALPVLGCTALGVFRKWHSWWVLSVLCLLGLVADAVIVNVHDAWPHSLFYASPILALAPAVFEDRPQGDSALLLRELIAVVTVGYVVGALFNPALGGSEFGSRYLLIAVPGLSVLAWCVIENVLKMGSENQEIGRSEGKETPTPDTHRAIVNPLIARILLMGEGLVLVCCPLLQLHGMSLVHGTQQGNHNLAKTIDEDSSPVMITSVWWAPLDAASVYGEKPILFAGDAARIYGDVPRRVMPAVLESIRRAGIRDFSAIVYGPDDMTAYTSPAHWYPISASQAGMGLELIHYHFGD